MVRDTGDRIPVNSAFGRRTARAPIEPVNLTHSGVVSLSELPRRAGGAGRHGRP
jgi:hypothetical protein